MYYTSTLQCRHCQRQTLWPRWARIEHLRYIPLCWECFDRLDEGFTPENAIAFALIIVGVYQGSHPIGGVR
jgi:hypothetical protein